jgi:ankyrin repeat protein
MNEMFKGYRLLGKALYNGHIAMIELLLERGADPNLLCWKQSRPLDYCFTLRVTPRHEVGVFCVFIFLVCGPQCVASFTHNVLPLLVCFKNLWTSTERQSSPQPPTMPEHRPVQSRCLL